MSEAEFTAPTVQPAGDILIPTEKPAAGKGGGGGGSRIMITTPQGQTLPRVDYIKALVKAGWQRGQIHTHLRDACGDTTIRYQTVYGLTKDDFPKRAGTKTAAVPQAPVVDGSGESAVTVDEVAPEL
jgi:hypothetical protein